MEIKHFIGIDVSKETLDITVVVEAKRQQHLHIQNTLKDIKTSMLKLLKEQKAQLETTCFVWNIQAFITCLCLDGCRGKRLRSG